MFYNDLVTHTRWLASLPYPTSFLYPHFETANNSPQCFIPELCIEGCRPIADVGFQLNIALFILNALVLTAVAAPAILCRFSGGQISDDVSGNHVGSLARAHKNTGVAAAPVQDHAQPPDPALTETSAAASVSKRGKSKIVGGVASGSSSNSAQARAQIASGSTEADTDLPEATRESQPDESSEITTGEVTTPEVGDADTTQNASGDGSIFGFLQSGLYRSVVYLVGQFTTHAIRYQLIPRLGNHPLLNSLYGRDSVLSIFAIAEDEFKGDVEALHRAIRETHGGNIRFATFRRDISPDSFRAEIKRLHDDCRKLPDTHLFIYLTGHGNNSNKMIIPESKTISETDLFELLSTTESTIMITILFDICRRARIPSAVPPTGISLIWACSLGETAGACGGPDYGGPNSCFLNALMMSAHTPSLRYTSEGLKSTIQERLDQLMDYLEEVYTTGHPMGRCAKCSGTPEPCDKPRRQNIDWSGAENMNGLLELTKILSSSKFAEEVYRQFMGDDTFLTVNKLSDPRILRSVDILDEGDALAASHIPDENTHKRGRGANDPVHAGKPQGEGVRVTLARRLDGIKDSTQTSFFIDPAGSITVNTVEAAVGGYY